MTVQPVPSQSRSTHGDATELKSDAQLIGVTGVAAAAMIGVAHAEVAATLTAGLTALATVPLWLRARKLQHAVVRSESARRLTGSD